MLLSATASTSWRARESMLVTCVLLRVDDDVDGERGEFRYQPFYTDRAGSVKSHTPNTICYSG
jgi:hypothetical protein